jgi:hypothetical protein
MTVEQVSCLPGQKYVLHPASAGHFTVKVSAEMIEALVPRVQEFSETGACCSAARWRTCRVTGLAAATLACVGADFPEWTVTEAAGAGFTAAIGDAPAAGEPPAPTEGYRLVIVPAGARIDGRDAAGLWYGLQTLRLLLDSGDVPVGEIIDWPAVPRRGIHLDLKGYGPTFEPLLEIVRLLARYKINVILLEVEDKFAFASAPGVAVPEGYTAEQMRVLSRECAARQIQVMPKLQSLGHVDYLLKHPQYAALREDNHPFQYCARNEDGFRLWASLAEELLAAFPEHQYFHVGADEAMYLGQCPVCKEHRRADTYIHRVQQCTDLVRAHGKTPVMWEDILRNLHGHLEEDELKRTWALGRGAELMYWVYGYGGNNNVFPFIAPYLEGDMTVWGASGFSGCGPSWVQNVPPLPERALNIAAWTKAAVEHKLQGVVTTGWTKIASADPPAEPIEACWFTMLYAADSLWAGRERALDVFCKDAFRSFFGAELPEALLGYLLQRSTRGLAEVSTDVPRNAARLALLLAAARYDDLERQRTFIYETLHMYHGLLDGLADYRVQMLHNRVADYRRVYEECRSAYAMALTALAGSSTVQAVIQSRFDRDAEVLADTEQMLSTLV